MYGEQEGTMPHFYLKSPFIFHEFVCAWPFYIRFTASTVPPQVSWACNTRLFPFCNFTFALKLCMCRISDVLNCQHWGHLCLCLWNGKNRKYCLVWKFTLSHHSICTQSLQQSDSSHANWLIFLRGKNLRNRHRTPFTAVKHSVLETFCKLRDIYVT